MGLGCVPYLPKVCLITCNQLSLLEIFYAYFFMVTLVPGHDILSELRSLSLIYVYNCNHTIKLPLWLLNLFVAFLEKFL